MFVTLTLWLEEDYHIVAFALPKHFMGQWKLMPMNLFKWLQVHFLMIRPYLGALGTPSNK